MGNYLSRPNQIYKKRVEDVFNEQLTNLVLSNKQKKYDKNVATIDATIAEFKKLDQYLLRDKDKAMIAEKLNPLLDSIDGKVDFSDPKYARKITNDIRNAVDDDLKNAVASTANYKNYLKEVSEIKKKKPELYSQANDAYSRRESIAWLNGKTDNLGQMSYVPYDNYQDRINKQIKLMKDMQGTRKVDIPSGDGKTMIRKEISGLTPAELRQIVPTLIDQKAKTQMAIDGWAAFGGNDEKAKEFYKGKRNELISNEKEKINKSLEEVDVLLKGNISEKQKKDLNNTKKILNSQLKTVDSRYDAGNTAMSIGAYIGQKDFVNKIADMYGASYSRTIVKDPSYSAKAESKKKKAAAAAGESTNTNKIPLGEKTHNGVKEINEINVDTKIEKEKESLFDLYEKQANEIKDKSYNYVASIKSSDYTEKQREKFDIVYNSTYNVYKKEYSEEEAVLKSAALAYESIGDTKKVEAINKDFAKLSTYNKRVIKTIDSLEDTLSESKSGEIYNILKDTNADIVIDGNMFKYKDVLKEYGITDAAKFNQFINTEEGKKVYGILRSNMIADEILNYEVSYTNNLFGNGGKIKKIAGYNFSDSYYVTKDDIDVLEGKVGRLAKINKIDNYNASDVFDIYYKSNGKYIKTESVNKLPSNTRLYLKIKKGDNQLSKYIYDSYNKKFDFNSITDNSRYSEVYGEKAYSGILTSELEKIGSYVRGNKELVVNAPVSERKDDASESYNQASAIANAFNKTAFKINKKQPIKIDIDSRKKEAVFTFKASTGESVPVTVPFSSLGNYGELGQKILRSVPKANQAVELDGFEIKQFGYKDYPSINSKSDISKQSDLLLNESFRKKVDYSLVKKDILTQTNIISEIEGYDKDITNVFKELLDRTDKFGMEINYVGTSPKLSIYKKEGDTKGDYIAKDLDLGLKDDRLTTITTSYPQSFYTTYLKTILYGYMQKDVESVETYNDLKQYIFE